MHIEEIIQKIVPADRGCMKLAQTRFDNLIKPVGSLAKLEEMTSRYCGIKGIYEKEDLDYPKRDLLVWCGIEEAAQAEKIMHAKWPVNVLAAETGAKAVALLVTSEEEADALEEGAALVQELVRNGTITQEEARNHPYKNIITRALGADEQVQVDAHDLQLSRSDVFLLCSDGLTDYLTDEELQDILLEQETDLQQKARKMVDIALERGGRDNITVLLLDGEVAP